MPKPTRTSHRQNRLALIRCLFDQSAERYERDITPLFAPLAADLVAYARPRRVERALDVGTGTGIVARLLAPYVRRVIGLDISPASLRVARRLPTPAAVSYVLADLHAAPFAPGSFSLVIASFGLNATDPRRSLPALARLVAPGGRLVLQEWGPEAPFDAPLREALDEYALENPGEPLRSLRDRLDAHTAYWSSQLQDVDDYRERLAEVGLEVEHAAEAAPVSLRLDSAETYLNFRFAWTQRYEEIRAMPAPRRSAFYAEARARLAEFTAADGSLTWAPVLLRVSARRANMP